MRAKLPWVQPDTSDPVRYKPRILTCCHVAVRTTTAREQEFAGSFAGCSQIVIDRLDCSLNSNLTGRPVFLLSDSCAIRRVSARGDILNPYGDDITAAKLAVDCQIEHGQIASAAFNLEFHPDRPDVFGPQRRFCSGQLPLFHGTRLGVGVLPSPRTVRPMRPVDHAGPARRGNPPCPGRLRGSSSTNKSCQ